MNKFKINILKISTILMLSILSSCDTFDPHRHLSGRYYLNHTKFGKCICYRVDDNDDFVELINGSFGSIGFDENYIIVQNSKYEYFIIRMFKDMNYSPEKGILGPLNLDDFSQQKKKLKISADFTLNTN